MVPFPFFFSGGSGGGCGVCGSLLIVVSVLLQIFLLGSADNSRSELISEIKSSFQNSNDEQLGGHIPHFLNERFSHKNFFEEYSFNEWEWSSFNNLLTRSIQYCQKNETFAASWTIPIKCEYYLIIRALRRLKDIENELNTQEKHLLKTYIEEIYGSEEENAKRKELLKSSFDEKIANSSSSKNLFQLKTILATNDLYSLREDSFIAEQRVLEKCSDNLLSSEEQRNDPTEGRRISIAFFMQLSNSHFNDFYINKKKISEMPFFQSFVKSFLSFEKKRKVFEQQQRQQQLGGNLETPIFSYQFSLFIGYDDSIATTTEFLSDFEFAFRFFLGKSFQFIQLVSVSFEKNSIHQYESSSFYHFEEVKKRENGIELFFFPFVYQQLIQTALSREKENNLKNNIDYLFFMRDNVTLHDSSFFDKIVLSLGYNNVFFPNFGLFLPLQEPENHYFVLNRRMHFQLLKQFPLTAFVLNNSYLNHYPKNSRDDSLYSWQHMYFTLLDIYSVFQPELFDENTFVLVNSIDYEMIRNQTRYDETGHRFMSTGMKRSLNRYKVLVERTRRTIAKAINVHENYLLYHSCINEKVMEAKEELKEREMTVGVTGDGSQSTPADSDSEEEREEESYSHPVQFFWRPNQLIYEVNGLFSMVNF
jgi:hypothetical protein